MREYLPVLIVGAIIGMFALLFVVAYAVAKRKNALENRERNMPDSEIVKRLLAYAKPYRMQFVLVFFVMLLANVHSILSPLIIGNIEETVVGDFDLSYLGKAVAVYAGLLVVSLLCTYIQAMVLQRVGQKILSAMRQDVFTHIEGLSHAQLNDIPVGKLVTRVTNDPNAISFMFTNILVTLIQNVMVVIAVLGAMLLLNYMLTLMVLCFVPFVVLFTIIFRRFSRSVHLRVNDATTDVNTYLSENLSGIKITQIFNREERKMQDFLALSKNLEKAKRSRMFVFGIFQPMVYMLYISLSLIHI